MRTKTVFTSAELPHIWANQSAPHGRSPGNGSFNGRVFRSYDTDLALILEPGNAVLLNVSHYSITTTGTLSRVRSAVSHFPVQFTVSGLGRGARLADLTGANLRNHYIEAAHRAIADAAAPRLRANTRAGLLAQADEYAKQANRAADFFKLRRKPVRFNVESELAKVSADLAAKAKRDREAAAKRAALCGELAPRVLPLWRAHAEDSEAWKELREEIRAAGLGATMADFLPNERGFNPDAALRLSADGSRVETSRGAQVLVRTVRFLWEFCATARAKGEAVAADLVSRFPVLDNYRLTSIDARGNIVAGCHRIPFSEVETIARALDLPPFNGKPMGAATVPSAATVAA